MSFPIESLHVELREVGLVVAAVIGFGFGFVLERAGFGRANKLAAQFYLYDMTVFKVMFGAIVTAMLGVVAAAGLGMVDLAALSSGAVSATYILPMAIGGFMLGAGFIVSGYCPGTSLVASASGNLDGLLTISGVIVGSVLYGELFPLLQGFHASTDKGQLFLYDVLDVSPAVLAAGVTVVAVLAFIGAEKVERLMTARMSASARKVVDAAVDEEVRSAPAPRRFTFVLYGLVAAVTMATLLAPQPQSAEAKVEGTGATYLTAADLAVRIFDKPWGVRVLDLRSREACAVERIPGAECVPAEQLGDLGLGYGSGKRALVLVDEEGLVAVPEAARGYKGEVLLLQGGHKAWHAYALQAPPPVGQDSGTAEVAAHRMRAAVHAALTGKAAAPLPAAPVQKYVPKKKKKGGGCE